MNLINFFGSVNFDLIYTDYDYNLNSLDKYVNNWDITKKNGVIKGGKKSITDIFLTNLVSFAKRIVSILLLLIDKREKRKLNRLGLN